MVTPAEIVGRRIKTPGHIFEVPGVYFKGRVKSVATERENAVNLLYDDGGCYWMPVESVERWLIDEADEGDDSDDLEHEVDTVEETEGPSYTNPPGSRLTREEVVETSEEKRTRIDTKKYVEETTRKIGADFKEDKRMSANQVEYECLSRL
ncbi:hypothetical protein CYMTET_19160 [Cymbomonas tetramitiformis]|uniref:Uncharacterized protein n=1 Tax=Cymbomonas tetramitiformis TaxID=36881 RepID=A0AAE0L5L1_9CHLO|nr:hypothetical protein CYMTET_19160 [Cymbomonas tetramitiformis]